MSECRMLEQVGESLGALGGPIGISEGHCLGDDRQLPFDGRRQPAVTASNEGLQTSHRSLKAFHG